MKFIGPAVALGYDLIVAGVVLADGVSAASLVLAAGAMIVGTSIFIWAGKAA